MHHHNIPHNPNTQLKIATLNITSLSPNPNYIYNILYKYKYIDIFLIQETHLEINYNIILKNLNDAIQNLKYEIIHNQNQKLNNLIIIIKSKYIKYIINDKTKYISSPTFQYDIIQSIKLKLENNKIISINNIYNISNSENIKAPTSTTPKSSHSYHKWNHKQIIINFLNDLNNEIEYCNYNISAVIGGDFNETIYSCMRIKNINKINKYKNINDITNNIINPKSYLHITLKQNQWTDTYTTINKKIFLKSLENENIQEFKKNMSYYISKIESNMNPDNAVGTSLLDYIYFKSGNITSDFICTESILCPVDKQHKLLISNFIIEKKNEKEKIINNYKNNNYKYINIKKFENLKEKITENVNEECRKKIDINDKDVNKYFKQLKEIINRNINNVIIKRNNEIKFNRNLNDIKKIIKKLNNYIENIEINVIYIYNEIKINLLSQINRNKILNNIFYIIKNLQIFIKKINKNKFLNKEIKENFLDNNENENIFKEINNLSKYLKNKFFYLFTNNLNKFKICITLLIEKMKNYKKLILNLKYIIFKKNISEKKKDINEDLNKWDNNKEKENVIKNFTINSKKIKFNNIKDINYIILNNDTNITSPKELKKHLLRYYENHFNCKNEKKDEEEVYTEEDEKIYIEAVKEYNKKKKINNEFKELMNDIKEEEIKYIMKYKFNTNCASDYDLNNPKIIKYLLLNSIYYIKYVTKLFNMINNIGIIPNTTTYLKIIKKKENMNYRFNNIRPISIINIYIKIYLALITYRLYSIILKRNININNNAYFPTKSPYFNIKTLDKIIKSFNNIKEKTSSIISIDLSSAYDNINIKTLINKLKKNYNIENNFTKIIKSINKNTNIKIRTQYGYTKSTKFINGIPQGSPLAPALFNLYLEEILNIINTNDNYCFYINIKLNKTYPIYAYADDIILLHNNPIKLKNIINIFKYWSDKNHLKINMNKSNITYINDNKNNININEIEILKKDINLNENDKFIYLGIEFNKQGIDIDKIYQIIIKSIHSHLDIISRYKEKKLKIKYKININLLKILIKRLKNYLNYFIIYIPYNIENKKRMKEIDILMMNKIKMVLNICKIDHISDKVIKQITESYLVYNHYIITKLNKLLNMHNQILIPIEEKNNITEIQTYNYDIIKELLPKKTIPILLEEDIDKDIREMQQLFEEIKINKDEIQMEKNEQNINEILRNENKIIFRERNTINEITYYNKIPITYNNQILPEIDKTNYVENEDIIIQEKYGTTFDKKFNYINIFTDASYDNINNKAGGAILIDPDPKIIEQLKNKINKRYFKTTIIKNKLNIKQLFLPYSTSSFNSEIYSILYAIYSVPINYNIHLYTDSESSIKKINNILENKYVYDLMKENCGYILINLITIINIKRRYGYDVKFTHINSHTNAKDFWSLSNEIADKSSKEVLNNKYEDLKIYNLPDIEHKIGPIKFNYYCNKILIKVMKPSLNNISWFKINRIYQNEYKNIILLQDNIRQYLKKEIKNQIKNEYIIYLKTKINIEERDIKNIEKIIEIINENNEIKNIIRIFKLICDKYKIIDYKEKIIKKEFTIKEILEKILNKICIENVKFFDKIFSLFIENVEKSMVEDKYKYINTMEFLMLHDNYKITYNDEDIKKQYEMCENLFKKIFKIVDNFYQEKRCLLLLLGIFDYNDIKISFKNIDDIKYKICIITLEHIDITFDNIL